MDCDYYVHSDLVIVYYDALGALSSIKTNRTIEKCYLSKLQDEDSDDDQELRDKNWKEELQRCIEKKTYKKTLYENNEWIKESYKKRFLQYLTNISTTTIGIVKIYKDYHAWERL